MPSHETLRLSLGEVDVPMEVITALVRKHVLRTLRLASNGHVSGTPTRLPDPAPTPTTQEEDQAPVLDGNTGAP